MFRKSELRKIFYPLVILSVFLTKPGFSDQKISSKEASDIGMEAYLFLYPLVTMDVTRKVITNYKRGQKEGMGPTNEFSHMRTFPPAGLHEVVRPNFDTLYSNTWLDLSGGPLVISAPDTNGRYYLLPMLDMWTEVFNVPGKRTSGTKAGKWVVVPPDWKGTIQGNYKRINAPTPYVWIIGRTQTNGPEDYPNVNKLQNGYVITPYSQTKPVPHSIDPKVDMKTDPLNQVNRMSASEYFSYGAELMKTNKPYSRDKAQLERMKKIGIEVGKSYDLSKVDPVIRQALEPVPRNAVKLMQEKLPTMGKSSNGWRLYLKDVGTYGTNYFMRAMTALAGLGANLPQDAIYPLVFVDTNNKPIMGGNKYVINFKKNEIPPVNAFWSITLYDKDGFHIPNPINRFAIGDRDKLIYEKDGTLNLYIQDQDPGGEKSSNWLPSPRSGSFGLTMRLYWPKPEVVNGRWNPPGITRVP